MKKPDKDAVLYENRELSWLKFNQRVLEEAEDSSVPLFERLKFVAIFASNLDEFYMIRVGSLYDQSQLKHPERENKTNMTPSEQLAAIYEETRRILPRKDMAYFNILSQLSKNQVTQLSLQNLSAEEYDFLELYFEKEIRPLISPQIIDKHHPFPFLKNKEIYIGVHLATKGTFVKLGIVPASGYFDRIIYLPGDTIKFILVEDLIWLFADKIFNNYRIIDKTIFRITRNADINPDEALYDEEIDFRDAMKDMIKRRRKLAAVRLELFSSINVNLMHYLCSMLELREEQTFITGAPLDLSFAFALEEKLRRMKRDALFYEERVPQPSPFIGPAEPMMRQILRGDLFLSYPYESIAPFIRLLEEAASAPEVASVKITLYRVAKNSQVVNALIKAAENGKDVLVVVELRARFDEENNIGWSKRLEDAGCTVIYGLDGYKVHSKLLLITIKNRNHISYITQIGTGNYNEKTSRLYTDFSLMTANKQIGLDASVVFNGLSLGSTVESASVLMVAPKCLRANIVEYIDKEIAFAEQGQEARLFIKMNSLSDKTLIDKLIEASHAGVKITLIVRGICCLRSGVPGYTDNITVKSIVGRYLEHARVYVFGVGERRTVYISSADFMTRNTERRVEVAAPIYDAQIQKRILDILYLQDSDTVKARLQMPDGTYERPVLAPNAPRINSQDVQLESAYEQAQKPQYETGEPHMHAKLQNGRFASRLRILFGKRGE